MLQRTTIISQGIMKVWLRQPVVDRRKVLDRVSFGSLNFMCILVLAISLCISNVVFLQRDDFLILRNFKGPSVPSTE